MNATNVAPKTVKGTSPTLVRPRFAAGMLLQHEDLEQLNTYTRELSRLMFRSLFGCGVVCGLVVKTEENCGKQDVTIDAGVALACSGDPIHVPKNQRITIDEYCDPDLTGPLWIVLCATVKCCAPRTPVCGCDEDETETVCTRERDGFEIRLLSETPKCFCGCNLDVDPDAAPPAVKKEEETDCWCADPEDRCYQDHYEGKCGCTCSEDCASCSCDCVVLARLDKDADDAWTVDHGVRRFVRPVLMRDPQVSRANAAKMATYKARMVAQDKAQKELQDKAKVMAAEIRTLEKHEAKLREAEKLEADEKARTELEEKARMMSFEIRDLKKREADLLARLREEKRAGQAAKGAKGRKT